MEFKSFIRWGYFVAASAFILSICAVGAHAKNLTVFNIVPPLEGCEKYLADDIVRIKKDRVADVSLVLFSLVPEGNPPVDKLAVLEKRYKKIAEGVAGRAELGVLLQSTIGHGYVLKNPNNLEHVVSIGTLRENPYKCCPLGENVIAYMQDICRRVAKLKPSHIMIDDDFRMYTAGKKSGCLCKLHLAEISKRLGREISAKEASARMHGTSAEDRRIAKIIDETIADSVCRLAEKMREAIDEVDPTIRGSVCVCIGDIRYAARLGKAFAGRGYKPIIRINNARYAHANTTPRNFAETMYKTITQLPYLCKDADVIAETDTLPHNRYGTSARSLHANYCGYILDGCKGAKQWITPTSEYRAGLNGAYRRILSEHADFYEALAECVKNSAGADGFATPYPKEPFYNLNPFRPDGIAGVKPWAQTLCSNTGIPANFAPAGENPSMVNADDLRFYSDAEVLKMLGRGLAVDGRGATVLCSRGFGKYLGVRASASRSNDINVEIVEDTPYTRGLGGKIMCVGDNPVLLDNLAPSAVILSSFAFRKFSQADKAGFKKLSPAATLFKNELGGTVLVFASETGERGWFSYMRYPRKDFFLQIFNKVEPFSFWYPADAEMYARTKRLADGSHLVALFNFGWDPLEKIELGFSKKPLSAQILRKNGKWEDCKFSVSGGVATFSERLEPMYPVILKIRTK